MIWPLQDIRLLQSFYADEYPLLLAPPHVHCPHHCNTIARLSRNTRSPPTPLVYAMNHTKLVLAISCKAKR